MIEKLITRIREEKGMTKTELCRSLGVHVGHLTHMELGTRKPSYKLLKVMAKALGIPFQPIYHTLNEELDEQQIEYNYTNYVEYKKIPAFSDFDFVECPEKCSNASFAYRVPDDTMAPLLPQNSYAFIEINAPVKHKEVGLFKVDDEFLIRKLFYKKGNFILKAANKSAEDIVITENTNFSIIGKIDI